MGQAASTVALRVSDFSGQRAEHVSTVPKSFTVRELVGGLVARMGLARNDAGGRPLEYQARLDREGRHLNGGERVGDALRDSDEILLTPSIDAG